MHDAGAILVLNAGSSSIKLKVFTEAMEEVLGAQAEGIGSAAQGAVAVGGVKTPMALPDHEAALAALMAALEAEGWPMSRIRAAGHRVVHGGADLTRPMRLTPEARRALDAASPLAPLHNPHNLAGIDALTRRAPELPQVACFDTAFHATTPEVALRYAVPDDIEARGIRRYGFHGISYASLTEVLPRISGAPLPDRVLALHLGNGASICAIHQGRAVGSTMGYSPVEGLTMGTRSGTIGAGAVLRLAAEDGIAETAAMLNQRAGLKGLSGGLSDMRALLESDEPKAGFAVEHFCYWAVRHGGGLVAAMGGVDALAFTGGIGEHAAPVRAKIAAGFAWLGLTLDEAANGASAPRLHAEGSDLQCWIVPAEEERQIAAETLRVLEARG